jgi:hypothetical protein
MQVAPPARYPWQLRNVKIKADGSIVVPSSFFVETPNLYLGEITASPKYNNKRANSSNSSIALTKGNQLY